MCEYEYEAAKASSYIVNKRTEHSLTVYILVSIDFNPNCRYACAYFATTDTTMADSRFSAGALLLNVCSRRTHSKEGNTERGCNPSE